MRCAQGSATQDQGYHTPAALVEGALLNLDTQYCMYLGRVN